MKLIIKSKAEIRMKSGGVFFVPEQPIEVETEYSYGHITAKLLDLKFPINPGDIIQFEYEITEK